jgi:hypothetical protein
MRSVMFAGFAPPPNAVNFGLERIEAATPNARSAELREERFERREGIEGEYVLTLAAAHGVTHKARLAE